eukprot:GHVH01017125.1.p1 GENE.GHVH01017125.1~~GHVH01017125.1.p1  ORF type:complete len:231 (-),score=27.54 GHVH01017125.1:86-778(-)
MIPSFQMTVDSQRTVNGKLPDLSHHAQAMLNSMPMIPSFQMPDDGKSTLHVDSPNHSQIGNEMSIALDPETLNYYNQGFPMIYAPQEEEFTAGPTVASGSHFNYMLPSYDFNQQYTFPRVESYKYNEPEHVVPVMNFLSSPQGALSKASAAIYGIGGPLQIENIRPILMKQGRGIIRLFSDNFVNILTESFDFVVNRNAPAVKKAVDTQLLVNLDKVSDMGNAFLAHKLD